MLQCMVRRMLSKADIVSSAPPHIDVLAMKSSWTNKIIKLSGCTQAAIIDFPLLGAHPARGCIFMHFLQHLQTRHDGGRCNQQQSMSGETLQP